MKRHLKNLILLLFAAALLTGITFAAIKEAQERSQIPEPYKWDLGSLYKTDTDWEADFNLCEKLLGEITRYQGKLGKNSKTLLAALQLADEISIKRDKLYAYANLRADEDTRNTAYQNMYSRATDLNAKVNTAAAFMEPEILTIADGKIKSFLAQEKGLRVYAFYLEKVRRLKPHIRSAAEEAILASSGNMYQSISNVYVILLYADMKFPKIKDEQGKPVQLSHGVFASARESLNRDVRREAYESYFNAYGNYMNTFASIISGKLKGDWFYAKNANYPSCLEWSLNPNDIPVSVYDNLIKTVNENLKPVHRYYALRKKISGLKDYSVFDNSYPVVAPAQTEISYEKAREIINAAFKPMGEDYLKIINRSFDQRCIDVYENKGKRDGAYSQSIYGCNPYILLNFQNSLNDTLTLAHELGHSAHSYLVNTDQPYIYSNYPVFLAEVASTFNEQMVMKYLLENTKDKKEKLYLILNYLWQANATLYVQTMYAEFEKEIHTRAEQGKSLSKDEINALWYDLSKKYMGDSVIMEDITGYGWARIHHFFKYAYYVYQYSTCFAASTALFDQVMAEGKPAQDRYFALLKAGGSDYPINILKKAGVDMTKPESILPAVKLFEKLLDEAEKLVDEGVK